MALTKNIGLVFLISILCSSKVDCFSQQLNKETNADQYRAVLWAIQEGLSFDQGNVMIKEAKSKEGIGTDFEIVLPV